MPERLAFRMKLNPGQAAEYEKRHTELWPDPEKTLRDAGVSDTSIWHDPESNHLFAILTRADGHTMATMPDNEIVQRNVGAPVMRHAGTEGGRAISLERRKKMDRPW